MLSNRERNIKKTVKTSECLTYEIITECSVLRRWGLVCVRRSGFWGVRSKVNIVKLSDILLTVLCFSTYYNVLRNRSGIVSRPYLASKDSTVCFILRWCGLIFVRNCFGAYISGRDGMTPRANTFWVSDVYLSGVYEFIDPFIPWLFSANLRAHHKT